MCNKKFILGKSTKDKALKLMKSTASSNIEKVTPPIIPINEESSQTTMTCKTGKTSNMDHGSYSR